MRNTALGEEVSRFKFFGEMVSARRTMPPWAILVGLVIFVTITSPFFLHPQNICNVLRQSVILGIISIGQSYVILTAGIDLSMGSTISLVSVLSTGMMGGRTEMILPAVVVSLVVGLAIGLANGLIITKLKVPDFLATLGMMFIIGGTALAYTPKPAGLVAPPFSQIARASWGPLPVSVIGFGLLVVIAILILNKTALGRYIYAVGGDAEVARLSGIKVQQTKLMAYLICGFTSALSGLFVASRTRIGDPMVGSGFELASIAAVVIGGTSLFGGRGGLSGTLAGVLIISVLANILNLHNVGGYTQLMIRGAIIILVVSFYERKKALSR